MTAATTPPAFVQVCGPADLAAGPEASLVGFADEIDKIWLDGVTTAGLTPGASALEVLVEEMVKWSAQRGFEAIEPVRAAEEQQPFALPRDLQPPRPSSR